MTATLLLTDALAELATALPGQVSVPGDADWDAERLGFNVAVDQQPVAVVHVAGRRGRRRRRPVARSPTGLTVAAQPVGHGATTAINGTILLRTRGLQEIRSTPSAASPASAPA